jgi:peptidyl-prolyl cis-trans isomerase SurA
MKKQKIGVILRLLSLSLLMVAGFWAQAQERQVRGTAAEKIMAKVDSYIVLKSDMEARYLAGLREGQFGTQDGRCRSLEDLVKEKLLAAKAEIDSVEVSEEEIQADLDYRMGMMISSLGGESVVEAQFGKSLTQIRQELYEDVKEQNLADAMRQEIIKDVKVSPSEVRRFFEEIPRNQRPFYSAEIRLGMIEKKPVAGEDAKAKVRAQLTEIREKILSGEATFAEMALRYSMDGTSQRGGDLGFQRRGDLDPTYEAISMKMKVGEISPVFESQFGYHIVELLERRGTEYNTRHIIIIPEPNADDRRRAAEFLDSIRVEVEKGNMTWEYAAKEFSDDRNTKTNGGFITGRFGQYISVDDPGISPDVFLTIDTMKVGSISRPLPFRKNSQEPESLRILYYSDRIPPHEANLKQDFEKIQFAALQMKQDKRLSEWFEKARREVFIEIAEEYNNCGFWAEDKRKNN